MHRPQPMIHARASRVAVLAVAAMLAGSLAACSGGSPSADESTALPTPSRAAVVPSRVLEQRVHDLMAAKTVSVDEDLHTGSQEHEVRLTWGAHGSVVDASTLPIGPSAGVGTEVFRNPDTLLQRPAGGADSCWSPGGDAAARFDRPVTQEVAVLRSVRATSGDGDLLTGTVSAPALLGVLGSEAQLQSRGLSVSAGARVPATFGTTGDALEITTTWGALVRASGSAKGASGIWLLRFRDFGADGPTAPTADMMCP
jgi:hypothetical protein